MKDEKARLDGETRTEWLKRVREIERESKRESKVRQNRKRNPKYKAEKICEFGESRSDLKLQDWQLEWFTKTLYKDVSISALSLGRGGGKTPMGALLIASCIDPDGPLYMGNKSQCVIQGPTLPDCVPLLGDVRQFLGIKKRGIRGYVDGWREIDSQAQKLIEHEDGSIVNGTGHIPRLGRRVQVWVSDESAFYPDGGAKVNAAIQTTMGKIDNDKAVVISTQSDKESHWFSRLLHQEKEGVLSTLFCADEDDPLGTWEKAYPNLHINVPNRRVLEREAKNAGNDPFDMAQFLTYRANIGYAPLDDIDLLVPVDEWKALVMTNNIAPDYPPEIIGVDLGEAESLSCAVGIWDTGLIVVHTFMGNHPEYTIEKREANDRVPGLYQEARLQGELTVFDGIRTPGERRIARWLKDHWGKPKKVVSDYFSKSAIQDAFEEVGWDDVLEFYNNFEKSDSIGRLKSSVKLGYIERPDSLLLDAAMGRATIATSSTGWIRQIKPRGKGPRDDPASALLHCWGWWNRQDDKEIEEDDEVYVEEVSGGW